MSFLFQCGCGHHAEVTNYMDAAEHYVLCPRTSWWTMTCIGCDAVHKINDPHQQPESSKEAGEFTMLWCVYHLIGCAKKSPEELLAIINHSADRYERFLLKNLHVIRWYKT